MVGLNKERPSIKPLVRFPAPPFQQYTALSRAGGSSAQPRPIAEEDSYQGMVPSSGHNSFRGGDSGIVVLLLLPMLVKALMLRLTICSEEEDDAREGRVDLIKKKQAEMFWPSPYMISVMRLCGHLVTQAVKMTGEG